MNSLPSYLAGIVQWLQERGHSVSYRCNKFGSYRYSLDGSRELTALAMIRRANRLHGYSL